MDAALELAGLSDEKLRAIGLRVRALPALHLVLQAPVPALMGVHMERLCAAIAADHPEEIWAEHLVAAVAELDTPALRDRLRDAVSDLREASAIDAEVAAYAIVDLAESPRSELVGAAVLQAAGVAAGAARTPSGVIVART